MHSAVSFEDIRPRLLTLEQAQEQLASTEPLNEHVFPTGSQVTFDLGDGWAEGTGAQPSNAFLTTPAGSRYQLTRQAVEEAGAYAGVPRQWFQTIPANLQNDILNYKYRTGLGDREFKVLSQDRPGHDETADDGTVTHVPEQPPLVRAMCRGTIQPYSNLALLEAMLGGIHERYGQDAEVFVDYKFHHDLERTNLRLIVPGASRVITGTRVEGEDTWCTGLSLANSLIGVSHPGTRLDGYLFRWWCTNGETDELASAGKLGRRNVNDPAEAYQWAARSVDDILGGLEQTFDLIQALTTIPVTGDVQLVLADLFQQYSVPVRERNRIIAAVADLGGEITLYDLQQAITQVANGDDLTPRTIDRLLGLGGHLHHAAHERCDGQFEGGCRRLIPEGWHVPEGAASQSAEGSSN